MREKEPPVPYAAITVAETLTMADYHEVGHHLGPRPVDGLLTEAAGRADAGLHVITLWESEAHQRQFIVERLLPAFREAGLQPGPMNFTGMDVEALYVSSNMSSDEPVSNSPHPG
jgi:hypothetical protein